MSDPSHKIAPPAWNRRRRLLWRTAIISTILATGLLLAVRFTPPAGRYDPSAPVEGITSRLSRPDAGEGPEIRLRDVAAESGIRFHHFGGRRSSQLPEDMGSGAAWGDYDDDGDEDLFLVNISGPLTVEPAGREAARCALYRNLGRGRFEDVSAAAGVDRKLTGMAAAWFDFDGDKDLDLLMTAHSELVLLRNKGNGSFADTTREAGLAGHRGFFTGVSCADYDQDGWLDAYVCGYVRYASDSQSRPEVTLQFQAEVPYTLNPSSYAPERNLLLRNTGKGTFEEVGIQAGVANELGRSLSVTWCDFNQDGWLDLYVANDVSDNALYLNLRDGRFFDASHLSCTADPRGAMGLGVADWDRDGDQDIFVTHWIAQENGLYSAGKHLRRPDALEIPVYSDVADRVGLGQISLDVIGWGTSFFDVDNDGRLDLYVVNGSTFQRPDRPEELIPMRHQLFWNRGARDGFHEVGAVTGEAFTTPSVGRGAAHADYDEDGDLDLVIVNHSGPAALLRNDGGNKRPWLQIRVRSQRDPQGRGALIRLKTAAGLQVRQVGAQASYLSQSSMIEHFGLGTEETVESVEVAFPGGKTVKLENIPANRRLTIDECAAGPPVLDERQRLRDFWQELGRAGNARLDGKHEEAIRAYRRALELRPDHEDALYSLGNCLSMLGRKAEALSCYERLIQINPTGSSRGHMRLGRLHAELEAGIPFDPAKARTAYQRALEVDPDSGAGFNLAELLVLEGHWAEALTSLDEYSRVNTMHPGAPYVSGFIHWRENRTEEAARAFEAAGQRHRAGRPAGKGSEEGDVQHGLEQRWAPLAEHSLFGEFWRSLPPVEEPEAANRLRMVDHYRRVAEKIEHRIPGGSRGVTCITSEPVPPR